MGQIISCFDSATLSINGIEFLKFWLHPSANKMTFAGPGDATIAITKKTKAI